MTLVILTTLGAGKYEEATYQWADRAPLRTKLVSAALKGWFPQATVKVLCTPRALQENGALLSELLPDHQSLPIANGENDAHNWQLFQTVADSVPNGAEVIFDITHGFRSLPVVTLLALSYLRAVKNVTVRGVVYGAWERGRAPDDVTPVFDLTPMLGLLDWASAAERFIDTGDARRIVTLLNEQPTLASVNGPISELSSALGAQRPAEASHAAQQLRKAVKKIKRGTLPPEQQQFALALDHIEDRFDGIAHGQEAYTNDPVRVLRGQYHQIQFYLRGGQYAQAIGLTREWLLSVRLWKAGRDIWPSSARTEHRVAQLPSMTSPEWRDFAALWSRTLPLRNRFAHFHTEPDKERSPSADDIQDIQDIAARLARAVEPLGLQLTPEPARPA